MANESKSEIACGEKQYRNGENNGVMANNEK
jgi:hypothetical protein